MYTNPTHGITPKLLLLIGLLLFGVGVAAQDAPTTWCPTIAGGRVIIAEVEDTRLTLEDGQVIYSAAADTSVVLDASGLVTQAALSPDAAQVITLRHVGQYQDEIWLLPTDGKQPQRLLDAQQIKALDELGDATDEIYYVNIGVWAWLNADTVIFNSFVLAPESDGYPDLPINTRLWTLNVKTGSSTNLLPPGASGDFAFSHDRKWVSVLAPFGLHIINAADATVQRDIMPEYNILPLGEVAEFPRLRWLDDASSFLIAVPPSDVSGAQANGIKLWHGELTATGPVITPMSTFEGDSNAFISFAISPDGAFIAYRPKATWVVARIDGAEVVDPCIAVEAP